MATTKKHAEGTLVNEPYSAPKTDPTAVPAAADDLETALGAFRSWQPTAELLDRFQVTVEGLRGVARHYDSRSSDIAGRYRIDPAAAHEERVQLAQEVDAKVDEWQGSVDKAFEPRLAKARAELQASLPEPQGAEEIRRNWEKVDPLEAARVLAQASEREFLALLHAPKRPRVDPLTRAVRLEGIVAEEMLQAEVRRRRPVEVQTVEAVESQHRTLRSTGELVRHIVGRKADKTGASSVRQQYRLRGM